MSKRPLPTPNPLADDIINNNYKIPKTFSQKPYSQECAVLPLDILRNILCPFLHWHSFVSLVQTCQGIWSSRFVLLKEGKVENGGIRTTLKDLWKRTFKLSCAKFRVPSDVMRTNELVDGKVYDRKYITNPEPPSSFRTWLNNTPESREYYGGSYEKYVTWIIQRDWATMRDPSAQFLAMHPAFSFGITGDIARDTNAFLRELAICYGYDDWFRDFTAPNPGDGWYVDREIKLALIWCNFKYFFKRSKGTGNLLLEKGDSDHSKCLDSYQVDFLEFMKEDLKGYMTEEQAIWADKLLNQRVGEQILLGNNARWNGRGRIPCFYRGGYDWENRTRSSLQYQRLVSLFNDYNHPFLHAKMPDQ